MQEKEGSASVRESVLNLQHAGVVSSNVKELSSKLDQEVADKRASPLRFTNTVTRNRGVSPVRIPTIFAKADSEAQKYKVGSLSICLGQKQVVSTFWNLDCIFPMCVIPATLVLVRNISQWEEIKWPPEFSIPL